MLSGMTHKHIVYTRNDLVEILKVSLSTVGNLINDGEIYSVRAGKSIRIPDWALDDYLAGRKPYNPDNPLHEHDGGEFPTPSLLGDGHDATA